MGVFIMKKDSDMENPKNEDEVKSDKSKTSKFFNKLDFAQISELDREDTKVSDKEHDPHSFPLLSDILGQKRVERVKSKKSNLLVWVGIIIGFLFIVFGAVLIMGSPDRVADNVVFGEKEVFSVFLILIGALIIACSIAYKFLGKTFFQEADDSTSYDKTDSVKNKMKKDNIDNDNKY